MANSCQFKSADGHTCDDQVYKDNFCYWHNNDPKTGKDLKLKLEQRAKTGVPMVGFSLYNCDLSGVDLVNHGDKNGYQLIYSDLYHANLSHAHCFSLDLTGSSLMKSDLSEANLQLANLNNTNLLGTKLKNTHLTNAIWGKYLPQEIKANKTVELKKRDDLFQEAEETYRNLRKAMEGQGLFEIAGIFFRKEMIMARRQLPRGSFKRTISKMVDLFCGYGELPMRVVMFSMMEILSFALMFYILGINTENGIHISNLSSSVSSNFTEFGNSLYFSIVTFTTLGYGDIIPMGFSRAIAALEAFLGSFTIALFVVVFVKKMTR